MALQTLVGLERVRLALGTRVLFDGVTTGVAAGERVGVVGGVDAPDVGGLHAQVGHLSGGERRPVALARLLADDPGLLVDEPDDQEPHVEKPWAPSCCHRRSNGRGGSVRRRSRATCPSGRLTAVMR